MHDAIKTGEYTCVIIEPMQSEGGDRYATERFFRALRLLTRHHQTFLVFDEVQVGFGLGGPFAWHSKFRLLSPRGQQDYPDAVTFAKRAQVGVVMSRFADPEPASAHNASLVRGRIHADMVSMSHNAERIEKLVAPRLAQLARAYPHLVQHPRAAGYAFAFDLPTPALLDAFIGQRFWRGAVVFARRHAHRALSPERLVPRARDRHAVRDDPALAVVARRARRQEAARVGGPARAARRRSSRPPRSATASCRTPRSMDAPAGDPRHRVPGLRARAPHAAGRDPRRDRGCRWLADRRRGAGARRRRPWQLVAFAIGGPLEQSKDVEGCDDDPMLGKHNTMYSVSITVAPSYQSSGIGRKLKELQLRDAAARKTPDGTPRYRYVTGRNRVGRTAQMTHLNRVFGAHVVASSPASTRIPKGRRSTTGSRSARSRPIRWSSRTCVRARDAARRETRDRARSRVGSDEAVRERAARRCATPRHSGLLYGPAVNKLTLMNYVTPGDGARARVDRRARARAAAHLPDVVAATRRIDKALRLIQVHAQDGAGRDRPRRRLLRPHRRDVPLAVAIRRRIAVGPGHFDWPRVPHPAHRRHRRDDQRAARRGRRRRRAGEGARLRLRDRAGAHGPRAADGLHRPRSARCARSSTSR